MRTTLDITDDVLYAAKDLARRERKTVGQVVSDLMRQALNHPGGEAAPAAAADDAVDRQFRALGFATLPPRGGVVTNELINQLREREGV